MPPIGREMTMATSEPQTEGQAEDPSQRLEHGTYEVIRNRLSAGGKELRARLEQLNAARKEVFGAIETRLLGTERVTTDNNCVPRDVTAVGLPSVRL